MSLTGYVGKILWVDLTKEQIKVKDLDEAIARKYLGGSGLAAKIVWDETDAGTEPFSPENPLLFMTGPLTATAAPASSRYFVAAISPLTGIWGEANSGGKWATELKRAGFDGIVFEGQARKPTFLWVNDGDAKLLDASHLWGKDTYEVTDLLKGETDEKASVVAIGQAGERMVRFACVVSEGRDGRAAARCGMGAVMGSKNLKAIVVRGRKSPKVHDEKALKESAEKNIWSKINYSREKGLELGKSLFGWIWYWGRPPIKNWREGAFEGFRDKLVEHGAIGEPYFCAGCRTGMPECYMLNGERKAVYEAIGPLGSQCLIDDFEAVQKAYSMCNRFGMDSISTGAVVSFGMEAYERGLISKEETGGIDLVWGNQEAMVEMVRQIGMREGIGTLLGEGVKRAAEHIGGIAHEFALHVKGAEFWAHDPRAANSAALSYATENQGPSIGVTSQNLHLQGPLPELEISKTGDDEEGFFSIEGKGVEAAMGQDLISLLNCLGVCISGPALWLPKGETIIQFTFWLEWLNAATGWDMDLKEFVKCGERAFNLKRMINVRRGISRKDDFLPPRFLTQRLKEGGTRGNLPPLGVMLSDYYSHRGWSEEGIPTTAKLLELGLEDVCSVK